MNQVYVFGRNVWNLLDGECYDVEKRTWAILPSYPQEVWESNCTISGESIYIVGRNLGLVLRYDIAEEAYHELKTFKFEDPYIWKTLISRHDELFVWMDNGSIIVYNKLSEETRQIDSEFGEYCCQSLVTGNKAYIVYRFGEVYEMDLTVNEPQHQIYSFTD
jgi:hypothetical protein